MTKGRFIVLSGPSGVGKGTIVAELRKKLNLWYSISMTTRNPRQGEVNGINYYFVTKEEFENNIRNNNLLEYATYNGNYYGTPRDKIEEKLNEGIDVISEIEVKGAKQIKELYPDAILIFIAPPSMEMLRERLINRGTESTEKIDQRIKIATEEMRNIDFYDHIIINDDLDVAIKEVLTVLK